MSSSHVFKGELNMVRLTKSSVRSEMSEGSAVEREFSASRWVRYKDIKFISDSFSFVLY